MNFIVIILSLKKFKTIQFILLICKF